ncbi:hypothetical protein Salat_0330900 [Sesamum alatum]|uniref:Uncharacterized protein n=1 Tax=Sesamum alatum TaxID=300844 RepID=A0AAE1Z0C3_9LAMI|nr:hypothetical protein Salat_0330900 [Sesamum alatum]
MDLNRRTAKWQRALSIEKDYWRQKSSCKWLLEGDRNTRFFHSLVRKKRAWSFICSIQEDGVLISESKLIQASGAAYFERLPSSEETPTHPTELASVPRAVTPELGADLCRDISEAEGEKRIWSQNPMRYKDW